MIFDQNMLGSEFNLHLGCGPIILDNFINIDGEFNFINRDIPFDRILKVNEKINSFILKYDLRRGLPDFSVEYNVIYHSHFIEHLTLKDGRNLLADCFARLKNGGVLRFAVPDIEKWCSNYVAGNESFFNEYRNKYLKDNKEIYPTKSSVMTAMLYNWGHNAVYDFEYLGQLAEKIGFSVVNKMPWGKSDLLKNISSIEGIDHRAFESLVIECVK